MKEMSKVKAYMKKSLASILSEKNILTNLHYSLISNLNFSFQDKEYLYLVLDYLPGGDLRYYLSRKIIFNEAQIKFIISNLLLSLKYIHNNNVLHRDIKPENLVFDDKGYLHLTDFGISRKIKNNKPILDKSGTPGYISPEVLLNKPQTFCSDFFSVGVLCYELVYNKKPFKGKNKKEITEKILYKDIKLTKKDIPDNYSLIIGDFINKLLKRNFRERLGNKGIQNIMNHPWLEGVNWDIIEAKLVANEKIPFWPSLGDNFDNTLANKKENMDMEHYEEYLKKINDSGYFKNFYFNYFNIKQSKTLEKTSNSLKNTSNTDGLKTSRSEVENFLNNISMRNVKRNISYIKINTNNLDNNDGQNKERISTESKVGKQYKIKIKTNTILSNKSRIYEKQQLNKFNRALLFDYNYNIDDNIDNNKNDENNNKDIKIN
jgi:serum/glucocorticoid-regulated kinase 2